MKKRKPVIMSVQAAARKYGISIYTIYAAIRAGKLLHVPIDDRVYVSDNAMKKWREDVKNRYSGARKYAIVEKL